MKKYVFLLLTGLTFSAVHSQEISDAIRYSQDNLTGTARFRAMGGAFGALGGDLSSINVNPAGSAVFTNNQVAVTVNNNTIKNNSNYFGTNTSTKENAFDMNQAGGVFVFKNQNPYSNWKKFNISLNYENSNNYDNSLSSAGVNPNNSIASYFLSYANGVELSVLEDSSYGQLDNGSQQAFLGYQGYVINPVSTNIDNTQYTSNVTPGGNYFQRNNVYSTGYNGKASFNVATSYKDKLFIGLNLNSHFADFTRSSSFYETNTNPLTSDYTVRELNFKNDLYTHGTGFSFQLGAIAKITNEIRVGLSYESSTWFKLSDELSQSLVTVSKNTSGELPTDVVNPNVTNYYAPYKLQTPDKVTFSLGYVFGKSGLISIDYAIKNYGNTKFKPENDAYFTGLNNEMSNTLASTGELRVGAEYKIKALSLRVGYRFEESPYKNSQTIGDFKSYSGGLGYNFGVFKLDVAYAYGDRNSQQPSFNQGFTDAAKVNSKTNNAIMTLSFEL